MAERALNILLVEDDEVDVMNVQRAFERNHLTNALYVAGNGLEALELLRGKTIPKERRPPNESPTSPSFTTADFIFWSVPSPIPRL